MTNHRLLVASMLAVFFGMFIACGGVSREEANKRIKEADALWAKGEKSGAVSKYKAAYTEGLGRLSVPEYEATGKKIFPRIVEFEVKAGNTEEAKTWIKRGLSDTTLKDKIEYTDPAVRELFAEAKKEHAVEAEVARKKKEAAAEKVTRANYNRIQDGMSLDEVQAILGPGRESASGQGVLILTWQSELTPFGANVATVTFQNGVVVGKAFAP